MPKGVYDHKHIKPKVYPKEMVKAVKQLYLKQNMSQVEVAAELGVTLKVIYRLMINHSIPRRPQVKRDQRREKNASWKGDNATYAAFHYRVEAKYGKPKKCSVCKIKDTNVRYDWANLTGHYENVDDYARMCRSCHRRYDKKRRLEGDAK